jgi:hypothetical protein
MRLVTGGGGPWIALALLFLSLLPSSAGADDDLATCTTVTARTADEIFAPMAEDPERPKGVTILPGETLCLAGEIAASGFLKAWLADPAKDERPLVLLRLQPAGGGTILHARTSVQDRLQLGIARIEGRAHLASFESLGMRSILSSGGPLDAPLEGSHRLLVGVYRIDDGGMIVDRFPGHPAHLVSVGFLDLTFSGLLRHVSVGGFDGVLRASGYSPLPHTFNGGSVEFGMDSQRWRLLFDFTGAWAWSEGHGGSGIRASLLGLSVKAGYDVVRWRGLTAFVLGGYGVPAFHIETTAPGFNLLGTQAAALGNPNSVGVDAVTLTAEAGVEEFVPLGRPSRYGSLAGAFYVFLRSGYDRQLEVEQWTGGTSSKPVYGMPNLDLSGLWVSLGVGIGAGSNEASPLIP